jgi:hypothetical protein
VGADAAGNEAPAGAAAVGLTKAAARAGRVVVAVVGI